MAHTTDPVLRFARRYHAGLVTSATDQTLYYRAVARRLIVPASRLAKRKVPRHAAETPREASRRAVEAFARRYRAGQAVARDSTWLYRQAKWAGLLTPRHRGRRCRVRMQPKLLDLMAKWRLDGWTLQRIAARFDLSVEGVRRMLIIRGVSVK